MQPKKRITLQKIPKTNRPFKAMPLLMQVCYYYPQYKLSEARRMPHKRVLQLLHTAQQEEAKKFYNLTQIAAAPHSAKGRGVKKLADHFKKIMESK